MKKFFDTRRDFAGSGPGSGAGGGGAGSGGGVTFIGRVFSIGRYQVTVEEIIAEGELWPFLWITRLSHTTNVDLHVSLKDSTGLERKGKVDGPTSGPSRASYNNDKLVFYYYYF